MALCGVQSNCEAQGDYQPGSPIRLLPNGDGRAAESSDLRARTGAGAERLPSKLAMSIAPLFRRKTECDI